MKNKIMFYSGIGPHIEEFLEFKTASGFRPASYRNYLRDIDRWMTANFPDSTILTMEAITGYCRKRPSEKSSSQNIRIGKLRLLSRFMATIDHSSVIVPDEMSPRSLKCIPYIMTDSEKMSFFRAADRMDPSPDSPNKDIVLPVMLRLTYCCGLRPQETRNIRLDDVKLAEATILIRAIKNRKDRRIVLSQDMNGLLIRYVSLMNLRQPGATYLFERPEGGPYRARWLRQCVAECSHAAGLHAHGDTTIRPYDLRHNFATSVVMKWFREGRDIDNSLVYLSEYMGHVTLDHTLYYINLCPEMLGYVIEVTGTELQDYEYDTDKEDYYV